MDLVLVGLPGSGKSAVGRRLAQRRGAAFVDLDDVIERAAGRTVPAIFAEEGEAGFRAREHAAILSLGPATPEPELRRVIATGGGAVVDPRNRWLLYRGRFPVWLDGPAEVLAQRLRRSPNVRPLVAGRDPVGTIRGLAAARRRFYAPALQINGIAQVGSILDTLERRLDEPPGASVTVLRADTPIGRVEIGHRMAATAVGSALMRLEARRAILLAEPRTWEVAGAGIAESLAADGWPVERILLPEGEAAKRLAVVEDACRELARRHVERREPLVAIGGGALTDAAGFVAATYLRGVPVVHVPTTLVGQIDAAIGGKTAVDLPEGKNLVGAFHQPAAVIVDVAFLATLPERERRAALGEAVKMAVLGDDRLLELLETDGEAVAAGDPAALDSGAVTELVERCAWPKVEVVAADEREQGKRITLNLGHSLGHAIEAAAGYSSILHGEAVAYGLRGAFAIAGALELTPPGRAARVETLLDALGLAIEPPGVEPSGVEPPGGFADSVREHLGVDKKRQEGRLHWVLPAETGVVVRSDVPSEIVEAGLAAALRRTTGTPGVASANGPGGGAPAAGVGTTGGAGSAGGAKAAGPAGAGRP